MSMCMRELARPPLRFTPVIPPLVKRRYSRPGSGLLLLPDSCHQAQLERRALGAGEGLGAARAASCLGRGVPWAQLVIQRSVTAQRQLRAQSLCCLCTSSKSLPGVNRGFTAWLMARHGCSAAIHDLRSRAAAAAARQAPPPIPRDGARRSRGVTKTCDPTQNRRLRVTGGSAAGWCPSPSYGPTHTHQIWSQTCPSAG